MRLKLYSVCFLAFTIQKVVSVTLYSPMTETILTAGISFEVSWGWDSPLTGSNTGSMDILLVADISATNVIANLDTGVLTSGLFTSATVPLNVPSGMYYIQLKVTSGTEKSAVNGPFTIENGSLSSSSSVMSSSPSASTSNSSSVTSSSPSPSASNSSSATSKSLSASSSSNNLFASNSQTSNTAENTVTNASSGFSTSNSSSGSALSKGVIAVIVIASVLIVIGWIFLIFWWRKRNRLVNAMTAKLEKEAQFYEQQAQKKAVQSTSNGPPSPRSPHDGSYNASTPHANASSTQSYRYVTDHNYAVDQPSQLPIYSPPAYLPGAHGHNPNAAYPMPMPAPYVRQQGELYHQQTVHNGYASYAENPVINNVSRAEVSIISSAPNTNDSSSLLNSDATPSSIRHVPHTPDDINSRPHLNDTPHPPHTE